MRATSEVLEDNRVRIAVEVDEDEVEAAVATAAKQVARQIRIPGFRPGKAPRPVVEARLGGAKALRDEALRGLLPDYYARAVSATEVEPISSPELNVTSGEESGAVGFDAVVEVRPQVHLTGYGALRVTIPSPIATDDEVDELLDQLRDTDAELREVARPIATGDYVTVDARGTDEEGTEVVAVDDVVYVVGSGTFVDTVDDQLPGMRAGETLEASGTARDGARLTYTLVVKDVRERVLPELTDEWVAENTELATAQELRDSFVSRIRRAKLGQARRAMRDATMQALADQVADAEAPDALVESETAERFQDLERNLGAQGVGVEQFLQATRQSPDDLVAMLRAEALRAVKVDLALRAVALDEDLTATPEALDEEVVDLAARVGRTPARLREELERNGRLGALRAEVTKQRAADWVLERVTFVDQTGSVIDRELLDADAPDGGPGEASEQVDQSGSEPETEEPT